QHHQAQMLRREQRVARLAGFYRSSRARDQRGQRSRRASARAPLARSPIVVSLSSDLSSIATAFALREIGADEASSACITTAAASFGAGRSAAGLSFALALRAATVASARSPCITTAGISRGAASPLCA